MEEPAQTTAEARNGHLSALGSSPLQVLPDQGEQALADFFDHGAIGLHWVGPDGIILGANQTELDLLGYCRDEYIGFPLTKFHADLAVGEEIRQCLTARVPLQDYEARLMAKDGSIRHVLINANGYWQQGQFIYSRCFTRDITDYKQVEAQLQTSEERYRVLYEQNPAMYFTVDAQGTVVSVNQYGAARLGYQVEALIGQPVLDIFYEADQAAVSAKFNACLRNPGQVVEWEFRKVCKDGSILWVQEIIRPILQADGSLVVLILCKDISDRKQAEASLQQAWSDLETIVQERTQALATANLALSTEISQRQQTEQDLEQSLNLLQATLESTADGIVVVGDHEKILVWNQKFLEMWQVPPAVITSRQDQQLVAFLQAQVQQPEQFLAQVTDSYRHPEREGSSIFELKNGQFFERYVHPYVAGGKVSGAVISYRDITARKNLEVQLRHEALHDCLTGLPNRALFMNRLEHGLHLASRRQDFAFAVLFLDLDRFKVINDSLGHLLGDQLLIAIAQRLKAPLRLGDTIARLGGDEFAILLEGISDVSEAREIAERLQQALRAPLRLNGQRVFTTASIGITLSGNPQDDAESLLRNADIAMYRAKSLGQARHEVFQPEMHAQSLALLHLETDLRQGIERQEFQLHYQPIICLHQGTVVGFEALLRWQHPVRGLVSPVEFIPLAEETGLIVPIGAGVIQQACQQLRAWQTEFVADPPLTVSVNLSSQEFLQPGLLEQLRQALQASHLPSGSLKLEITETALMENAEFATQLLEKIQALGIQLHVDDFGTGYSSLSYLQRLPVNCLKIDHSFVSRMNLTSENTAIVETIITLAHNLGLLVIAEGIETKTQLAQLKALGCNYGQGHLFAPALESQGVTKLIAQRSRW